MKLNQLWCSSLISLSLLFTACSSVPTQSTALQSNIKQQLSTQQPIVAYFSQTPNEQDCGCASTIDPTYSLKPIKDGYYRTLLGRDQAGRFLVQDFYQEGQKPQSSPIWIKDPIGLFSFENKYVSGPVTLYFRNGKVSYQGTLEDGEEVGKSQSFYSNGQLGMENEVSNGESTIQKLWYANGAKAAEIFISEDSSIQVSDAKVWTQDGQLVEEQNEQSEILEQVYKALEAELK